MRIRHQAVLETGKPGEGEAKVQDRKAGKQPESFKEDFGECTLKIEQHETIDKKSDDLSTERELDRNK
jgi:hypothetical protein